MPDRDHVSEYGQLTLLPSTGGLPSADCDTWLSAANSTPAFHWSSAELEVNNHFTETARRAAPTATTWSSDCGVRAGVQHPPIWPRNCPMDAQDRVFAAPLQQYDPKVEERSPMPSFSVHPEGSLSDFADEDDQDDCKKTTTLDDKTPKKKTRGRVKIRMEFIENKLRRYTTFSKRKTGIMKKAYELSTLTGTQVMLLVASETGHVYTFATPKLQPMITSESGKALIQTCLNSPDPLYQQGQSHSRMSSTGYEETELGYPAEEECKHSEMLNRTGIFTGSSSMNGSCQSPLDQVSPSSTTSLQQLSMSSLHGMSNYLPSAGSPSGQPKVASPSLNSYSQGLFSTPGNSYNQGHSPSVSQHAAVGRESTSPLLHPTKPHYHPQSPTLSPGLPQSTLPSTPHQVSGGMMYGSNSSTAMHGSNVQHGMSVFNQMVPNMNSQDISATTPSPHSPLSQPYMSVAGEPQQVQRLSASEFYNAAAAMVPGLMQRSHNNSSTILETPAYREMPGAGQPLLSGSLSHRISIAQ